MAKICKSVPARREAKRIRATFTNPVETDWRSAGGFVKSVKFRQIGENPRSIENLAWRVGGYHISISNPSTILKCLSRVANIRFRCIAIAAIQISFAGMGFPALRS